MFMPTKDNGTLRINNTTVEYKSMRVMIDEETKLKYVVVTTIDDSVLLYRLDEFYSHIKPEPKVGMLVKHFASAFDKENDNDTQYVYIVTNVSNDKVYYRSLNHPTREYSISLDEFTEDITESVGSLFHIEQDYRFVEVFRQCPDENKYRLILFSSVGSQIEVSLATEQDVIEYLMMDIAHYNDKNIRVAVDNNILIVSYLTLQEEHAYELFSLTDSCFSEREVLDMFIKNIDGN